jgi:hypothetical protein
VRYEAGEGSEVKSESQQDWPMELTTGSVIDVIFQLKAGLAGFSRGGSFIRFVFAFEKSPCHRQVIERHTCRRKSSA